MVKQKPIICPECKGSRMVWGIDESDYTRMQVLCEFCNGEGIVLRIKNIEYRKVDN
jgi:DnaJ-class molecular chaperone